MLRVPRWLAFVALLGCGCDGPETATQVIVILEADAVVAAGATRLGVEVVSQNGDRTQRTIEIGATEAAMWPFRVPIVPIGDDASRRVLVVAEAIDATGESLGVQRAEISFAEGEKRYVVLRFTAVCRQTPCADGFRCVDGACEDACLEPSPSPETPAGPGPCVRERVPDAGPQDAGMPDLGGDMGADLGADMGDAGPVVVPCPTPPRLGFVEDFEGAEVPLTCGAPPCESSPSGRVEVVSSGSVLAPDPPSPCGADFLRLVRFVSPSQSYFVAPVDDVGEQLHLRAFIWVEAEDGARVSVLGFQLGEGYRDPALSGVEVRVAPDRSSLRMHEEDGPREEPTIPFPLGRWVCAELSLDFESELITVAWDGARETFASEGLAARFATTVHARVGLFDVPDEATAGTAWVDEVAVSNQPLRCP